MQKKLISPDHTEEFKVEKVADKIEVFASCVNGWQLQIAQDLINTNEKAGFASLSIVSSYFEMIGAIHGFVDHHKRMKKGITLVFPEFSEENSTNGRIINLLINDLRNGLYHLALPKAAILLTQNMQHPLAILYEETPNPKLILNPKLFVSRITEHFEKFLLELKNDSNLSLRNSFEKFFDDAALWGYKKENKKLPEQPIIFQGAIVPGKNFGQSNPYFDDSIYYCNKPYGKPNR